MTRRLKATLGAFAWLAIVTVIALGAAGLVTGLDHRPGTPARADLTAAADAEVTALLDAAAAQLVELADVVDSLGAQARGALAALNGSDTATAAAAIAAGDRLVAEVVARTSTIRAALAAVPYVTTQTAALTVSEAVVDRHAALSAALQAADGLDVAWRRLSLGSVAATRMSGLLAEHDRLVGLAAERGRAADYKEAIALLDQADAQTAAARDLRDQLANTVDVTVLDEWLDRNAAYDVALRDLYRAVSTAGGKVTDVVRKAVAAESAAKARLPPDTRGLVVIMAEIGRGGMNGAVIAIEEARGRLTSAIDAATPPTPSPEAGSSADGAPLHDGVRAA